MSNYIFLHCPVNPGQVLERAKIAIYEWNVSYIPPLSAEKWSRPPEGFVKLNFLGTVNPIIEAAGVGGIVRNNKGEMKIAYSCPMGVSVTHPLEAKLKALHQGVFLCIRNGYKKTIIEGSCLILVESLKNAEKLFRGVYATFGRPDGWIKDSGDISFCRKCRNKTADQLTVMDYLRFTTFESTLPQNIHQLYLQEKVSITSESTVDRVESEIISFELNKP